MVKLVKANIRKDRSILAMFFLIIFVATILVNFTLFMRGYGAYYDDKLDEKKVGEYFNYVDASREDSEELLKDFKWIKEVKYTPILTLQSFKISVNDGKDRDESGFYQRYSDEVRFNRVDWYEKDESIKGEKIYVNMYVAASAGIKVGDKLTVDTGIFGKDDYVVAGIYEDYIDGGIYTYESFMIGDSKFEEIKNRLSERKEQNRIEIISDGSQDDEHAVRVINDAFIKKDLRQEHGKEAYLEQVIFRV